MTSKLVELTKKFVKRLDVNTGWKIREADGNYSILNNGKGYLDYEIIAEDSIRFNYGGNCSILLRNIKPKLNDSVVYKPIKVKNEKVISSYFGDYPNHTSSAVEVSETYEESTTHTDTNTISASVEASLEQTIGYGSELYGVSGETKIGVSVQTGYEKLLAEEKLVSSTKEFTLKIKPHSKITVMQNKKIVDAIQTIDFTSCIDCGIVYNFYGYWDIVLEDTEELQSLFSGNAVQKESSFNIYNRVNNLMRKGPIPTLKKGLEEFVISSHIDIKTKNSQSMNLDLKEEFFKI